jgi:peptidoglycan/LPS O-acetylase OafA/YrhL
MEPVASSVDVRGQWMSEAYRPDVDGLRAVAVLLVVGYHAWPALVPGGYLGVDVFFVISGFLITRLIRSDLRNSRFSFQRFYARRARRILPALLLVILSALAIGSYVLLAQELESLGRHAVGATFFVANFVLMGETGYFDAAAETKPLLHLWSLGIEEQFYLTFPLLLWIAWRRHVPLLGLVAGVGAVSWLLHLWLVSSHPVAAFYLPVTRAWELMAGAVVAALMERTGANTAIPRMAALASVAGALAIAGGVALPSFLEAPDLVWMTCVVAGSALVVSAGPDPGINRRLLSLRPVVAIGLISYPLYLWHWVLLTFLRIQVGRDEARPLVPIAIALAFGLAWAVYRFVERPVRTGVLEGRRVAQALAALAVVVVAAGSAVWATEGFPDRVTPRLRALAEFAQSPHEPFREGTCLERFRSYEGLSLEGCRASSPGAPSVVLLGDSHANQYYNSLAAQLPGVAVLHLGRWSCLPWASKRQQDEECQRSIAQARTYVVSESSVSTVILAGYWAYLMAGRFANNDGEYRQPGPLDDADTEVFVRTAHEVLEGLLASGKRVVLLLDVPNLDFNIQHCVLDPTSPGGRPGARTRCALDRQAFERRNAPYDAVMARLVADHPGVRVFDPRSVLCDSRVCDALRDGRPLYFDSDHLSRRGADLVVERLIGSALLKLPPS